LRVLPNLSYDFLNSGVLYRAQNAAPSKLLNVASRHKEAPTIYMPENVALLSDVLWPVWTLFGRTCCTSVSESDDK